MATRNAAPTNNSVRTWEPQDQTLQSIEWERFIDIGMCVLVCDWKVKDLLEQMLAQDFSKMSDDKLAGLAEKLPIHIHGDKRKRLSDMLKKTGLGGMSASEPSKGIRHKLRLSLYELQCVVEALGKDSKLVVELRKTRNNLVREYRKFEDESKRKKFLDTFYEFIDDFDFEKYFGPSHADIKKKYRDLSVTKNELMKIQSEYGELEKTLSKEIADWEESYKRQLEALEAERDQLKEQVETLKEQLERENAKRKALEADLVDKQQQLSDKDSEINRLEQQLAEVTEELGKTEEKLPSEIEASKMKDKTIRMFEEKKADMEHDVSERNNTIMELNRKLVNIARERIILQNYFDSQTVGKAVLTNVSVEISGKLTISHHSSLTTSLALFGVATDGWEQFHDIGLCVIAFDCKLNSLFELLLATCITTDNAIQVLFDSDEKNPERPLWHNKPDAEEQLKYLKNILPCIKGDFKLLGCSKEELIFLINAVNDALTKFIEIKQVNLDEFNRLRKQIRKPRKTSSRHEVCETSLLDEKREMLSDLLRKLLNTDLRIEVFQTALMLYFVQQRNLDAQRLHNRLREVRPADLFKDADQLFKDADQLFKDAKTLRIMRNDIVHTKLWFPEDKMRNKFLEAYRRVIDQMEFGNIYRLSDADAKEVKEAYLLPNVKWVEMTSVTVEYERVRQHCIELKQALQNKEGHICEQKNQIRTQEEKIKKQEKQIKEKDEQIRKLEKESRGMTRSVEQNYLNLVQVIQLDGRGMEPESFSIGTNQGLSDLRRH